MRNRSASAAPQDNDNRLINSIEGAKPTMQSGKICFSKSLLVPFLSTYRKRSFISVQVYTFVQ